MLRTEFHRPGGPRGRGDHAVIDEEIEIMLKDRLLALRPCGWLGEEMASVSVADNAFWEVDPHDGTRDFMSGLRGSAVSVALLENGQPILGVVLAPTVPDDHGDLFAWAEGGIVTRNGISIRPNVSWTTPVVAPNADCGGFASPDIYGFLETVGHKYTIRLKASAILQDRIASLLAGHLVDVSCKLPCGRKLILVNACVGRIGKLSLN